ncbi:MAG: SDR family oxidoreductase [SAR202 cluster bacterium]|jgi:2-dehydro-3-deoxy-L-rhamnonate dehydrogenase (NAD+)|nr:SDR family oxidoreductase [SAR202 cluster bacterium]
MAASNLTNFAGQVVLVTGAASGIGKAAAELIAQRGGKVICLDLNEDGLKITVAQIEQAGGSAGYKVLDVSSQSGVKKVVAEILAEHGQVHALANSAGISGPTGKPVEEVEWAAFQKTIEINLYGTIWLTQELMPSMKEHKYGRIVHLASIAGKEGNPGMSAYNASKAAVIGFVKGVAKECATFGITINAVAPAVIRTPINETVAPDVQAYMVSKIPVGRLGEPNEVAEIIAFAASQACSFTTGFTFDVSGGRATY